MREKPKEIPQGSLIEKTAQEKVEGKQICLKVNPHGLASVKSVFLLFRPPKKSPSDRFKSDPTTDQNRGGIYICNLFITLPPISNSTHRSARGPISHTRPDKCVL